MAFLSFLKKRLTVVTHSGAFHADDVFAIAILKLWAERNNVNLKIIRSREPEIIEKADIVVDVGDEYDPGRQRFDHHQKNGVATRENGIPYAAIGLLWKHYGEKICGKEVAEKVDKVLALPIDARDNGILITPPNNLGIIDHRTSNSVSDFNPTWLEPKEIMPRQFKKALGFAVEILKREIKWAEAEIEGSKITKIIIEEQGEPEILILEQYVEYEEEVAKHKNVKFVVTPGSTLWNLQTVRDNTESYERRAEMPESWRGLKGEALEKASGVNGAVLCIKGGWFAKAKTKEAAIEMAQKALRS